ncbi:MAG: hypothetical protein K0R31_613 [Clostridiales bacterium]|jgi:hypothetical protein|nr:hypothetical protein [Clostridiales bacterium]
MILSGFRLICGECGSDKTLEKSGKAKLDWVGDRPKYGEGIQRKCLKCKNESFVIFRTWLE